MTVDDLPAWSEPFHRSDLGAAPSLDLPQSITREWAYGDRSGAGVRVAIIDSGIDETHPAVGPVSAAVAVTVDDDGDVTVVEGPHEDLYGHGTACAAIVRELAPTAELVSVRVLGRNLKGSAIAFAAGVEWCLEHDVDIANLSLSTTNVAHARTFYELVDASAFRRMLLVSAMSNERKRSIPSEFAGVFSVACGPGTDRERFWCNPDGPADWAAAGLDVEVAWGAGASIRASGNSFAAPVIAGHLARLRSTRPDLTPWQARTVLAALAVNAPTAAP